MTAVSTRPSIGTAAFATMIGQAWRAMERRVASGWGGWLGIRPMMPERPRKRARRQGSAPGEAPAHAARECAVVVGIVDVADFAVEAGLLVGGVRRPLGCLTVPRFVAGAIARTLGSRGGTGVLAITFVLLVHGGVLYGRTCEARPRPVKDLRGASAALDGSVTAQRAPRARPGTPPAPPRSTGHAPAATRPAPLPPGAAPPRRRRPSPRPPRPATAGTATGPAGRPRNAAARRRAAPRRRRGRRRSPPRRRPPGAVHPAGRARSLPAPVRPAARRRSRRDRGRRSRPG